MSKLGIMGGTFNPVHNGHIAIAKAALHQYKLDKIMFLPNFCPPHKDTDFMADAALRLEMIRNSIKDEKDFFVSDYEIKKGGVSYTVDTLTDFEKMYPYDEIYFIIGGDSLRDFMKWYQPQEIVKKCILLVYAREGEDPRPYIQNLKQTLGAEIFLIDAPNIDISSSYIKESIFEGHDVQKLVPKGAMDIILADNLYKK